MKTTDQPEEKQDIISDLEAMAVTPEPETTVLKFPSLPVMTYDHKKVSEFLDAVFHAGLDDDENILTWVVQPNGHPSYPKSESWTINFISKPDTLAKALYFGTSTCKRDPVDNKLYNRKELFSSLRVVMLDDIGTKIKNFPDFPPSYKIESSAGNFQYGYILETPIDDYQCAAAFIQLVYESGYTDQGGNTPVKLVRLPEGVNGKKGDKCGFVSDLTELTDKRFTPQEIFDALSIHADWKEVEANAEEFTKRRSSKSLGASSWSSINPQSQALNGYIDPVLEWLYEKDEVKNDNGGPWIDVLCPWSENHTSGNNTARYAPLGRGDNEFIDIRSFRCNHGHCDDKTTEDYLKYIARVSGIQAGRRDPAAELATRYVFDKIGGGVWDVKSQLRNLNIPMQSFGTLHPHKVIVHTHDGKEKLISMTALWATSPTRVVVAGPTYDPSTTARIVESKGEKYVNLFSVPEWGKGPIDTRHVDTFLDFLEYLIPSKQDREYFIMWLAAKCQNMAFRGAGIVMVAPLQGVGRSTLADMLKTLMGQANCADVPFSEIVGESQYTEWLEKPFIVSEETLATDPANFYANYNRLKTMMDPRPRAVMMNTKYGVKREVMMYNSYLLLTNYFNAIALPDEDRRLYVIENALKPAKPAYFTELNNWLEETDSDGMPSWGRSVYRWLQKYEVDLEYMLAPPPATQAKTEMSSASLNDLDFAVHKLLEVWPDPYINAPEALEVFNNPRLAGPLRFDEDTNKKHAKMSIMKASKSYGKLVNTIHASGKSIRPRVLTSKLGHPDVIPLAVDEKTAKEARDALGLYYIRRKINLEDLADKVIEALQADDRL